MNKTEDSDFRELKKYYVYELVDSKTSKVFYVGKGQGERALQHSQEAANSNTESPKLNMINKIQAAGNEVIERVIGRYKTENEAFAVESTLIHWVYGYDNLTNLAGGHGCDSIRPFMNRDKIEGIDIPERIRSFDGAYSKEHISKRERNNIVSFMESLKSFLEDKLNIKFSEISTDKARFTTFLFHLENAKIVIGTGHSPTKLIWIGIESIDEKKENKNKVLRICENSKLIAKNNGSYAKLPNFKSTPNFLEIARYFSEILSEIKLCNI